MKIGTTNSKLAGAFGLLLVLILASLSAALAQPPLQPNWFYGDVTINGIPAWEGTGISARIGIDGAEYATTTVDADGKYGIDPDFYVPADDPETSEKDGGESEDIVKFYVLDRLAGEHEFELGKVTEVDLAVTGVTCTITATAGAGGSIAPPGDVAVDYGADQSFTITADACYDIADVLVDGASVGAVSSHTFTSVITDHTISATFALKTFTITASAGAGGSIAPLGDVVVDCGADQSFTITADPGYHIADVLVDGESVGTVSSHTFTNVTAAHTISAAFTQDEYTLTVNIVGNGSVAMTPVPPYHYSDVVTLTATAATGWTFAGWSGALTGTDSPATIEMTSDKTVTATFTQDEYALTVNIVGNGSVAKNPDQATYHYGEVVTLTVTASTGCTFDCWSGDLTGTHCPATIDMTCDKTVIATFVEQVEYRLFLPIIANNY